MSWEQLWTSVKASYKRNQWLGVILTALGAGTAFTVAVLYKVGWGLVALVDGGQLFLLLTLYAAFAWVVVQVLRALLDFGAIRYRAFVVRPILRTLRGGHDLLTFGHSLTKGPPPLSWHRERRARLIKGFPAFVLFGLAAPVVIFLLISAFSGGPIQGVLVKQALNVTVILVLLASVAFFFVSEPSESHHPRLFKGFILAGSIAAGGVYVDLVATLSPMVHFRMANGEEFDARLFLAAHDGTVIFVVGHELATYVPFSQVVSINASYQPTRGSPTTSAAPQ